MRDFKAAIEADPTGVDARINLAELLVMLGELPEAVREYETVLSLPAGKVCVRAWVHSGALHARLRDHVTALKVRVLAAGSSPITLIVPHGMQHLLLGFRELFCAHHLLPLLLLLPLLPLLPLPVVTSRNRSVGVATLCSIASCCMLAVLRQGSEVAPELRVGAVEPGLLVP